MSQTTERAIALAAELHDRLVVVMGLAAIERAISRSLAARLGVEDRERARLDDLEVGLLRLAIRHDEDPGAGFTGARSVVWVLWGHFRACAPPRAAWRLVRDVCEALDGAPGPDRQDARCAVRLVAEGLEAGWASVCDELVLVCDAVDGTTSERWARRVEQMAETA